MSQSNTTAMVPHTQPCVRCGNTVQIVVTNPSPRTRFFGPAVTANQYCLADHFVSPTNQRLCSGSGKVVTPAA